MVSSEGEDVVGPGQRRVIGPLYGDIDRLEAPGGIVISLMRLENDELGH